MQHLTKAALMLISVFLGGCALHAPVTPTPPVPLPEVYRQDLDSAAVGLDRPWWRAFDDPQLDRLIDQTLADNLDIEQTWQRFRQAEAQIRVAGAPLWPSLTANVEVGREQQPGVTGDTTGDTRRFSLAAAYELDLWGRLRAGRQAAVYRAAASREDLRSLYLSISAQVADLYYLYMEQSAQLDLTDRTINNNADTLRRVQRRYRAGLAPALEVHQARQSLAAAQAVRPRFEQTLSEALTALAVLLRQFARTDAVGRLVVTDLPDAAMPWNRGFSAQLLLQRPDVQAAALRLRALDRELAASIADRLPAISISGAVGRSVSDVTGVSVEGMIWNLFANLTAPLVDGGRRRAEVDRRRAAVDEALAGYRQTLLTAAKETVDALYAIEVRRVRVQRLDEEARAADAALRSATTQYFQGLRDYLEVLSAQRLQFDARRRLLEARRELLTSRITLARALGGGWSGQWIDKHDTATVQGT